MAPDHVELCPERPRAGLTLHLARLISDQSRLWGRGGLIWARVGDRGMPSRYTDTLAVMQRRGSIRRHWSLTKYLDEATRSHPSIAVCFTQKGKVLMPDLVIA